jgi:hypothetical protein
MHVVPGGAGLKLEKDTDVGEVIVASMVPSAAKAGTVEKKKSPKEEKMIAAFFILQPKYYILLYDTQEYNVYQDCKSLNFRPA